MSKASRSAASSTAAPSGEQTADTGAAQTEGTTSTAGADSAKTDDKPKAKGPTVIRKLTVKTVFGNVGGAMLPEDLSEIKLCKIVGFADGVKRGVSTYGDWAAVTGEFAATNLSTGEIFIGKNAIIPGAMGEAIIDAVERSLEESAESKLKFGVEISAKRVVRGVEIKHEYFVRPIIQLAMGSPAMDLLLLAE